MQYMPSFIDVIPLSLISRNQKFILLPTDNSSKSKEYTVDTFWVYVLRSLLNELSVNGGEGKKKKLSYIGWDVSSVPSYLITLKSFMHYILLLCIVLPINLCYRWLINTFKDLYFWIELLHCT